MHQLTLGQLAFWVRIVYVVFSCYMCKYSLKEGQSTVRGYSFDFLDLSADVIYLVMQLRGTESPRDYATPRGTCT